jgi:heat shock protein HslJ
MWDEAGNSTVSDQVEGLKTLLAEREDQKEAPSPPMPILPPATAVNDLATQFAYLDFASGSGVRFVGRLSPDASPITSDQLAYYFQGLSEDGQYYVSFVFPILTLSLPAGVEDMPAETLKQAEEDFESYLKETTELLNSLSDSDLDWLPPLFLLDALVESITIGQPVSSASGEPVITSVVANWVEFQDPAEENNILVENPDRYTLELLLDGTFRYQADCNQGSGTYTLDGNNISLDLGATTLAECGPDSLYDEYLGLLGQVASYDRNGDDLILYLADDAGAMRFSTQ